MSPTASAPRLTAATIVDSDSATPGLTMSRSARKITIGSKPPRCISASGNSRRPAASSGGFERLSMSAKRSPQRAAGETDQLLQHGDDPEALDHARLGPALELVVVLQRRHAEDAFARELERCVLLFFCLCLFFV